MAESGTKPSVNNNQLQPISRNSLCVRYAACVHRCHRLRYQSIKGGPNSYFWTHIFTRADMTVPKVNMFMTIVSLIWTIKMLHLSLDKGESEITPKLSNGNLLKWLISFTPWKKIQVQVLCLYDFPVQKGGQSTQPLRLEFKRPPHLVKSWKLNYYFNLFTISKMLCIDILYKEFSTHRPLSPANRLNYRLKCCFRQF